MNVSEIVNGENTVIEEEGKLKFREKLLIMINGGTGTFHNQMIQMFLLFFYSDVLKINMAYVATLFLVVRVVDAILAPMFGILIDKISTPWGKYKPWYIAIGVIDGLFGWLTFTAVDLGPNGKLIYATLTYFIYSTIKSIGQAPACALIPAVTKRVDERISMYKINGFLIPICALLVNAGVAPLYKVIGRGDYARGFSLIMGGVFVVTALIGLCQAVVIKERYIVKTSEENDKKTVTIKEMFSAIITNKTALIVYISTFCANLANGIRSGVTIYFFKYFFHNEVLMAIVGTLSMVPTLIGLMFSAKLTKRIGIKNNIILGVVAGTVSSILMVLVPPTQMGIIMYIVLGMISSLFGGLTGPAAGTMLPAAMDYAEWKTGKNISGLLGSFNGLLGTIATAISGAGIALALSLIGYVGGAVEQSASTVFWIKMLMTLLPTIVGLGGLCVIWFDLDEDKQAEISKDLAERRQKVAESEMV